MSDGCGYGNGVYNDGIGVYGDGNCDHNDSNGVYADGNDEGGDDTGNFDAVDENTGKALLPKLS